MPRLVGAKKPASSSRASLPQAMTVTVIEATRPWYREPWPWLLMSGPAIVIVAGLFTAWLAVTTNDGLVTEDYYKKGLAVHQTVARSDQATHWGVVAGIRVSDDRINVRIEANAADFVMPPTLAITISHPTRAGLDQSRILIRGKDRVGADSYSGTVRLPVAGHWLLTIEDEKKTWRLLGNVILPANGETLIGRPAPDVSTTNPVAN